MIAPTRRAGAESIVLEVRVQRASSGPGTPPDRDLSDWAAAALPGLDHAAELTVRLVDEEESRRLNAQYRQQDKATNVLSFPSGSDEALRQLLAESGEPVPLGDLVICVPVVAREATEQGKSTRHHWAHMVIHGVLHLAGYDHEVSEDADIMEARERAIMDQLGFPDPYRAI